MPNCSRRARFSRATCSCPPNIKEMVRRTIRIVFNIQAQSVSASLMRINPTRQMDFGEAQVELTRGCESVALPVLEIWPKVADVIVVFGLRKRAKFGILNMSAR